MPKGKFTVPPRPAFKRACLQCGDTFKTTPSQDKRFCSQACKSVSQSAGHGEHVCEACGKTFLRSLAPCRQRRTPPRFCSRACRDAIDYPPLEDRFWRKVDKTTPCWIWTGSVRREYGELTDWRLGIRYVAHRLSWQLARGPIPDGLFVLHNCPDGDNPLCVRPDHLWLGTQADNMRDMQAKGRSGQTRLTPEIVREGRRRYAAGEVSKDGLAHEIGVSRRVVHKMLARKTWGHVV